MNINSRATGKPKKVQNAVALLYATLGIVLIQILFEFLFGVSHVQWIVFLAMFGPVFGFTIFLIVMMNRGKNWARITYLVLFLLGFIPSILSLVRSFSSDPLYSLLGIVQVVLQITALFFFVSPRVV
jgi:uncharacterized membrane protein YqaE (UPF0057 family)